MTIQLNKPGTTARIIAGGLLLSLASACSISEETRALMDEYDRTIPVCQGEADCRVKWSAARDWVVRTPSYAIRVSSDDRIETYDADSTRAGTAIQVTRAALGGDRYQLLVNIDCYATFGCPPYWETALDFNRAVNAAGGR